MPAAAKKGKGKPKSTAIPKARLDALRQNIAIVAALQELELQSALEAPEVAMTEPPIDRDPAKLDPVFRAKLQKVLDILAAEKTPFKFHEGFRTVVRQQWLYGQGRPNVTPFGRPGKTVTDRNGTTNLSNHQGNGKAGSGCAADCYPLDKKGKVILEPPVKLWKRYAEVAESQGLTAGFRWTSRHDPPHVELQK